MSNDCIQRLPDTTSDSHIATGAAATARLQECADFIDARSTAFCTTSSWLTTAARHLNGEPVVITVHDERAQVVGLAALSRSRHRGVHHVELLGGLFNDYGQFHYDDPRTGARLAAAVATWIRTEHRLWSLELAQMPEHEAAGSQLLASIPRARVTPGQPLPQIHDIGGDYRVSRNRRRKANNALNRIAADGLEWTQLAVTEREELDHWLPLVIDVRRERDHACGRRSHLDDAAQRAFYEEFVRDRCAAGALTLDLLLVGGEVAGYGMVVADDGAHRVFDGRIADGLERYRGTIVCDLAAAMRASDDPTVSTFDWLRGRTDGKFGNHEVHRVDVVATSHAVVERIDRWDRAARNRVKAVLPDTALQRIARR